MDKNNNISVLCCGFKGLNNNTPTDIINRTRPKKANNILTEFNNNKTILLDYFSQMPMFSAINGHSNNV